ncbi:MAG: 30S ribosomal protein S13 [Candidatus Woykebacteria bacterium RIFCSPHIGHO2_12_FULL_45_10]|uniref:Small ribosomal subunit protein uS13 n=1 Tax=Candidatus Woykebacteria bacterium RIFCSPHIGHO2_12_FULL_45_10 TaxID=1802603 RepID=A0A1G1WN36_9BACT|nr:MAG: 30S ribosomal protein S13 [Candidatus Woykebacteria bacterium RIFCSPHIGHO2_12_FULL_45_10]
MARIAGIEIPTNKKIIFSLPYVYGVGLSLAKDIVKEAKVDPDKRVKDLSEDELTRIQKALEKFPVEGDLRRMEGQNIRRLEEIGTYRGLRHRKALPARGQRTRSNARTKRGKRITIGAMKKEVLAKMEQTTVKKPETS